MDSHWLDPGGPEQPTPFCGVQGGRVQKMGPRASPSRRRQWARKEPLYPAFNPSSSPGLSHSHSEDPTPDPNDGFGRGTFERKPRLLAVAARILFHHLPSFL